MPHDDTRRERARSVGFVRAFGVARVHYHDLRAADAEGRELRASLTVENDKLALRIDDDGARYPLFVDPLIEVKEAKLVASDAAASNYFGQSVGISGELVEARC